MTLSDRPQTLAVVAGDALDGAPLVDSVDIRALFESGAVVARIEPRLQGLQRTLPECRIALISFCDAPRRVLGILTSRGVTASAVAELTALFTNEPDTSTLLGAEDGKAVRGAGSLSALTLEDGGTIAPSATRAVLIAQRVSSEVTCAVIVWRDGGYGRFRESEVDTISAFASATNLSLQLRASHDAEMLNKMGTFLDKLNFALIVATDTREVVHMNASGRALVKSGEFFVDHERIAMKDAAIDSRFGRIFVDLLNEKESEAAVLPIKLNDGGLSRAIVSALRTTRDGLVGAPLFAVVVSAPKTLSISADQLMTMAFSRAEAELTVQLLDGCTVAEYARMRQLAIPTVRAHLKRAMMRVGVHRQADLLRVLLNAFQN